MNNPWSCYSRHITRVNIRRSRWHARRRMRSTFPVGRNCDCSHASSTKGCETSRGRAPLGPHTSSISRRTHCRIVLIIPTTISAGRSRFPGCTRRSSYLGGARPTEPVTGTPLTRNDESGQGRDGSALGCGCWSTAACPGEPAINTPGQLSNTGNVTLSHTRWPPHAHIATRVSK